METEIRELTRKEQLEYHIPFLKEQLVMLLLLIEQEENELKQINENLILERKKENEK